MNDPPTDHLVRKVREEVGLMGVSSETLALNHKRDESIAALRESVAELLRALDAIEEREASR